LTADKTNNTAQKSHKELSQGDVCSNVSLTVQSEFIFSSEAS